MKKTASFVFLIVFCIIFPSLSFSNDNNSYDVRKVRWGMSKENVINSEKPRTISFQDETTLIFEDVIFSNKCRILYVFEKNKLHSVAYLFNNFLSYQSKESFFDDIKKIISKKYNKIPNEAGAYNNDRTKIVLVDDIVDGTPLIAIMYQEINYANEFKKMQEQQNKIDENQL